MDDYPRLVFHVPPNNAKKRRCHWRFGVKDVIILFGIAGAMSGLMGLGCIMIIDVVEAVL